MLYSLFDGTHGLLIDVKLILLGNIGDINFIYVYILLIILLMLIFKSVLMLEINSLFLFYLLLVDFIILIITY